MNQCRRCGMCCWDWKGQNPADKCAHLGEDMVTWQVYDDPAAPGDCGGLSQDWPQPRHACDLPPDCGYVQFWDEAGLI